uniref:Uncharacterized protein n=1 Tax=Anopheles coluzzii TaxID=1518534 RepID=A0A8W7P959_ANOCL
MPNRVRNASSKPMPKPPSLLRRPLLTGAAYYGEGTTTRSMGDGNLEVKVLLTRPPSFSIVTLHFGHSFVLAAIQLEVSESSSHFLIHFFSNRHCTGSCQFSPHSKQNTWLHLQTTGRGSTYCTRIAYVQSADGHHRNNRLHCIFIKKKRKKQR